jgi:hypothetical protein
MSKWLAEVHYWRALRFSLVLTFFGVVLFSRGQSPEHLGNAYTIFLGDVPRGRGFCVLATGL